MTEDTQPTGQEAEKNRFPEFPETPESSEQDHLCRCAHIPGIAKERSN